MEKRNGNGMPNEDECLKILNRFEMPAHIIRHSQAVCSVATYLTGALKLKNAILDLELVRAAALLHDITKRYSFDRPLDHALTGAKLLKKLGFPPVASIVRQHVRISNSRPEGRISEVEIVNYSDKRVVNDTVTTLDERISYIRSRYGGTPEALERINKYAATTYRLEKEIFEIIGGEPSQILFINTQGECR